MTTADLPSIWVDFNMIHDGACASSLVEFASNPAAVRVGAPFVACDGDGNTCLAVVRAVDDGASPLYPGVVLLELWMDTFQGR